MDYKNNPSLSKSTLKYLVFYQVFQVEVQRLHDQCQSKLLLPFHSCVSDILEQKNAVMRM